MTEDTPMPRSLDTSRRVPIFATATFRINSYSLRTRAEWWASLTERERLAHHLGLADVDPREETAQWHR